MSYSAYDTADAPHADGVGSVMSSEFEIAVEELMAVAVAEYIGSVVAGTDCSTAVSACADAAQCVNSLSQCSGPGVDTTLACCDADQVCASFFGSDIFRCRSRASVAAFEAAEVLECP